ncbi:sensor histidine kinase [Paracoccus laeviglucosivorans]|uniref:histidine kinase n=1 Tax=Paracoccus laeviglucosivorans TaxID=1197861 RepID=A0A521EPU5_9RHOB|nr:GAF domain-containing protein [Paracoccus laeviglucosivorans]SMO85969.1 Two-component sensor histidine kinase, contains HisKA and HATPase domains [Paracoccus laeviglucosivorans]
MSKRIQILDMLGILDTAPEPEFDNIALVAKALCDTPVALISLVHEQRQWFKSRIGFAPQETPLEQSVCVHALSYDDLLIIPDLTHDPRTRDNTLVTGQPGIRFYAGAPILIDGIAIGSLCTIDLEPRPQGLTPAQAQGLRALAQQVASQILTRNRERLLLAAAVDKNSSLDHALRRSAALSRMVDVLQLTDDVAALLRHGSEILSSVIPSTRAGFGVVDIAREQVDMQPEWCAEGTVSVAGVHHFRDYGSFLDDLQRGEVVIITDVEKDPRTQDQAAALMGIGIRLLINVPVIQAGQFTAVGFVHSDQRLDLLDEDISFIRTIADRMQAAIQHKRNLEARELLNRELLHRVKNTLSVVTAVARQTLHNTDGALDRFIQRLRAIADANDLLTQREWASGDLGALVRKAMAINLDADRIVIAGPEVALKSQSAIMVSMVMHELLTNSMKYGALSTANGTVSITWLVQTDPEPTLHLTWSETGGPAVSPPLRKGFGSNLIELGLVGIGNAHVDYAVTGLTVSFSAELRDL